MSTDSEFVTKLKKAYRQWHDSKGSQTDMWLDLMADHVKFRSLAEGAGGMEFSKDRSSKEEVVGYLEDLAEAWEMNHYTPHQFIAQDDWVAVLCRCSWTNRKTGKTADTPKADFWRFENGEIVAFYEFYNTAVAFAAATED